MSEFDPKQHIVSIKGRGYLPVAARIAWFRHEQPRGLIETRIVSVDNWTANVQCTIRAEDGTLLAVAHGSAYFDPRAVWAGRHLEKAETAAIGRALALAGFGTQFAGGDFDDEALVDTPQPYRRARGGAPAAPPASEHAAVPSRVVRSGELRRWYDAMVEQFGATPELVRDALGVASALEWEGTLEEATERVRAYVNARARGEEDDDAS